MLALLIRADHLEDLFAGNHGALGILGLDQPGVEHVAGHVALQTDLVALGDRSGTAGFQTRQTRPAPSA